MTTTTPADKKPAAKKAATPAKKAPAAAKTPAPAKATKVPPAKGTARPPAPGKPARVSHAACYAADAHTRDFKGREACRRARREAATT